MLSASQIPECACVTVAEVGNWWKQMIDLGFNINPDDDPANCINIGTGLASFDTAACIKIKGIYQAMFDRFGEETYKLAQTACMGWMGYKENPMATADNGLDFWIPSLQ